MTFLTSWIGFIILVLLSGRHFLLFQANEEGSPYSGQDGNCGDTLLISLEEIVKDGLLNYSLLINTKLNLVLGCRASEV
ncbi:hypothetical protein MKW92_026630 [Papaver armeniacum]|nr:hypothetical protein MKW92_026630 [Papaver armeniacum]